ncbi:hypothetical protein MASSI9I_51023 [Massilia sp. 9I]|nr:hypothetical protein MASSI9I_51023 [Massilia sp. 9I]
MAVLGQQGLRSGQPCGRSELSRGRPGRLVRAARGRHEHHSARPRRQRVRQVLLARRDAVAGRLPAAGRAADLPPVGAVRLLSDPAFLGFVGWAGFRPCCDRYQENTRAD